MVTQMVTQVMQDKRAIHIAQLQRDTFDVLVVGGGINGAGIARDLTMRTSGAAGSGFRVALVDKGHFSSGTSGRNSQLIHGGLRYLKYFEIPLVREALAERATLLKIAPTLVEPLQFLLPCYGKLDRFFYGAGLTLYDLLAGSRGIHPHGALTSNQVAALEPGLLQDSLRAGLLFYDCKVHSARLTLENILDAESRGAVVANYVGVESDGGVTNATDFLTGNQFPIRAKYIVDATGAWSTGAPLRLVRGSHLVFPRIQQGSEAISYFEEDGRIVFFIPWGESNDLTLVGTTDADHTTGADDVHISAAETEYLTLIVRRLFPNFRSEPVSSYSSLRPLIKEVGKSATSTSREHRIWRTDDGIVHIAGGKYTTYRAMSEELVDGLLADLAPGQTLPSRTAEVPFNIPPIPAEPDARVAMAVEREFARKLADVLYISTYWGHERRLERSWLLSIAGRMGSLLGWGESRIQAEVSELLASPDSC